MYMYDSFYDSFIFSAVQLSSLKVKLKKIHRSASLQQTIRLGLFLLLTVMTKTTKHEIVQKIPSKICSKLRTIPNESTSMSTQLKPPILS